MFNVFTYHMYEVKNWSWRPKFSFLISLIKVLCMTVKNKCSDFMHTYHQGLSPLVQSSAQH